MSTERDNSSIEMHLEVKRLLPAMTRFFFNSSSSSSSSRIVILERPSNESIGNTLAKVIQKFNKSLQVSVSRADVVDSKVSCYYELYRIRYH